MKPVSKGANVASHEPHVETNVQNRPARCGVGGSGTRIPVGRRSLDPRVASLRTAESNRPSNAFPRWFALAHPTPYHCLLIDRRKNAKMLLPRKIKMYHASGGTSGFRDSRIYNLQFITFSL